MITEDKIAAAQLAQIFGSELTLIDEQVTHRSNNTSRVAKLESNVQIITDQMVQSSKAQVAAVPPAPQVEPLPAGN